jgi:leucyl-tRNA synthetase
VCSSDLEDDNKARQKIRGQIHAILKQATDDIERLQLNTVVSAAMKLFNLLQELPTNEDGDQKLLREGLNILLRMLAPIVPHITHYLWKELGFGDEILAAEWPKVDDSALTQDDLVEIIVQVNGKYRDKIVITRDVSEETIQDLALAIPNVQRFVNKKTLKKAILVPNKLINLVG